MALKKNKKQGNVLAVPHMFTPRDPQLELFMAMDGQKGRPETRKNRAILNWHRRAGKDKACWCYLIKEAAQTPGNYFYIFPTGADAKRALWRNVDSDGFKLLDHLPEEFIKRILLNEMFIELNNNSTIQIFGLDKDPDAIRGAPCKGVVFSEFAYSDPQAYKNMVPAIRQSKGWAIINSTPNGKNHFYERWRAVENSPRWYVSTLQTMWPDLPNYTGDVSPEELKIIQEEEGYTQDDMEREFGACFNTGAKGAIYADFVQDAYKADRIGDYMYDDTLPVHTYWDLGATDYTSCWFGQPKGDSITWIDYWEHSDKGTNALAEMLQRKGYDYGIHYLPHDAAHSQQGKEVTSIEENFGESLEAYGLKGETVVVPKTRNRQQSITEVRKRFPKYRFDSRTCLEGLRHLEAYHTVWDPRKRRFLSEPDHDEHSHCADALRMEAESLASRQQSRPNSVILLSSFDPFDDI